MEQEIREQADQLHMRGLHIVAQSSASTDTDSLKLVAKLWQEAWELYRQSGNENKARELETSLVGLYKKKYLEVHDGKKQQGDLVEGFDDWAMFFKIGCFGFGGPMAVFSLLENELVRNRKILTEKDFLEGAVLGDVLPGPVTMDIVAYTGYKLNKWLGALISTVLFILPSFVMMIILAILYDKYSMTPRVETVFKYLSAAVTGLILSVALRLSKAEMKDHRGLCIIMYAFTSALIFKLDIVVIVIVAGLAGMVLYHEGPPKELKVKL